MNWQVPGIFLLAFEFLSSPTTQSHNFTCCGIHLTDLHAVVEHFEVVHVVVADQQALAGQYQNALSAGAQMNQSPSYYPDNIQVQTNYPHAFDPDDMELELDNNSQPSSDGSTPPDTPINTPLSSYPHDSFNRPLSHPGSNCASPQVGSPPVSAFDTIVLPSHSQHIRAFPPSRSARPNLTNVSDVFNGYSGYSDYSSCMPGTVPSPPAYEEISQTKNSASEPGSPSGCVPPALLYCSADNTPVSTPGSSRIPSPMSNTPYFDSPKASSTTYASSVVGKADPSNATPRASTTLSRPASSLLLSKPFRCPKPNCNKSYKQANGLKYHMTHGSCNFAPPKDLEQVQALLASKRSQRQAAEANGEEVDASFGVISEGEMREVEREAERRLRPFACGVADCQRRYKNMNGLRYHYQHSGDHGAIGLALLASGQHECLQHARSTHSSRQSTPGRNTNAVSAPPQAQQQQQHQIQMQNQHYHQQQGQMQTQQMSYSSSAQPQQFMHSQQQQFGNPMTSPMAMPSAGMYMSRDTYMSG
jgi:transcription factor SFP1